MGRRTTKFVAANPPLSEERGTGEAVSNFYSDSKERRRRKFERQGGLCHWCKKPMTLERCSVPRKNGQYGYPSNFATFEHLQRRRDGGAGKPLNVVLACKKCNNGRDAGVQLHKPKPENEAARKAPNQYLIDAARRGTLNGPERGELFKRGLVPNWPMWSWLMAHVPPGNP